MDPEALLELLYVAADAKTDEEKARVAWRASDHMWNKFPAWGLGLCRGFNNLCQDQDLPWVDDLWSVKERRAQLQQLNLQHTGEEK